MPGEPWDVKVFQRHRDDDPNESCPAEAFLRDCPASVAADLIAIVDAVAASPPPQFTGGGMWEAMRGAMRGYTRPGRGDQTNGCTASSAC